MIDAVCTPPSQAQQASLAVLPPSPMAELPNSKHSLLIL